MNPHVLRAILRVESGLNPTSTNRNDNGTLDVGIGQFNSMHFKRLQRYGISPDDMKDACIGTYVSAWHLAQQIARHGNTWRGIASYHSATPYFNERYQVLLKNELVRTGVLSGKVMPVPPMRRNEGSKSARRTSSGGATVIASGSGSGSSLVFDGAAK